MTRRTPTKSQAKKRDWRTTIWYIIGVLIILTMVISLVASAFTY